MAYCKSGQGLFRYGRGSQKFGQSWDWQKMEEREMRRRLAREEKDVRKKFEGGAK